MGEYAMFGRERVKIGTCEDMYYLRADQAAMVQRESGSLDPMDKQTRSVIRFRFPWPDEDGIQPGAFDKYDRSVGLHGLTVPEGVEHHRVQFTAPGYVLSLPCPEGLTPPEGIGRNGFSGQVHIVQQAYRNGNLALICKCGGCGARYNLPTLEDAQPIIDAVKARAEREERDKGNPEWWRKVADRITAGYVKSTEKIA